VLHITEFRAYSKQKSNWYVLFLYRKEKVNYVLATFGAKIMLGMWDKLSECSWLT